MAMKSIVENLNSNIAKLIATTYVALFISALLFFSQPIISVARADYDKGISAAKQGDYSAAFEEWSISAKNGHPKAQYNLGVLFENGLGTELDLLQAAKWYIVAAERDYAPAQYNLAVLYHKGAGVPHSKTSAMKWYRKAALQLDELAMYAIGQMHINGEGTPRNLVEGYKWFYLSANLGQPDATGALEAISPLMKTTETEMATRMAKEWLAIVGQEADQ